MRASASTVDAQNEITRIRRQSNTTRLEQQIFGDMRGLQRTDHKLFVTVCHRQRRRPIAKRITELSGHAAGLASPHSSLRATDRLWEAARCRRTSGTLARPPASAAHAVRRPPGGLAVWRSCCLCWPRRDGGSCCGRWRSGPAPARSPSCSGRAIYHLIARGPSVFRGSLVGRRAAGIRIRAGGAQAGAGHGAVAEILRGGDHKLRPGPAVARRHPGAG